jgi:hypothetical protein
MGARGGIDLTPGPAGAASAPAECGPWHPGIESQLPRELLPLSTLFRPENVRSTLAGVLELSDLTGLPVKELVAFRPERLLLHELLIRVTAELCVPIGTRVEDLGINFRQMAGTILARHLEPRMAEFTAAFEASRRQLAEVIDAELAARVFAPDPVQSPPTPESRRSLVDFFRRSRPAAHAAPAPPTREQRAEEAIRAWQVGATGATDDLHRAACRALARVVASVLGRHGELWGTPELIGAVATDLASNAFGSDVIGRRMDLYFDAAARAEGYRVLPAQEKPLIMNTKGASAAGKSTLRPEQRMLAERIGAAWDDFALISPDIWRKQLLDYASLGPSYKYGGTCTGEELAIIDQKLDRYMAHKAARRATSHLLIDRFRFDSFAPDSDQAGSNLLTRFGHTVYMFFMITPPEAIVERAWQRGLEVGRYKAVDDLLAHNIEAYSGMPELFFTWALCSDKHVHYEFLDNAVPYGEKPRTVAFGWNGEMNVLDVGRLLDVERFRRVNVDATGPERLYSRPEELAPAANTRFLVDCARRLPRVNFAEQATGRIYLTLAAGEPAAADRDLLRAALADPDTRAGILAIAPELATGAPPPAQPPANLAGHLPADRIHTLGRWGPDPRGPSPMH